MQGIIKWFNEEKGFGFILGDDGNEYFLHASKIPDGVIPKENDKIEFNPQTTVKGKQAFDVELL